MRPTDRPIAARALAALTIAASLALPRAASPRRLPIAHAQAPTAAPLAPGACAITSATATADRAAVPIGGVVRLTLAWQWRCDGDGVRRDVLIVADPSAPSAQSGSHATAYFRNVHLALTAFADGVGWAGGQRFGTVLAGCPATAVTPLGAGEAAHRAWREGLATFPATAQRDMLGALELARAALDALRPTAGAPAPLVVVVDSGTSECGQAAPPATARYEAACERLRDAGATVAVLRAGRTPGRLGSCHTSGWLFRSETDAGTDLPAIAAELATRTIAPLSPTGVSTRFAPATSDWDLVGTLPVTDVTVPEVQWLEPITAPASGAVRVTAVLRAGRDALRGPRPLVIADRGGPFASLMGADGDLTTAHIAAPSVCIHAAGRALAECGVGEPIFAPFAVR